MLLFSPTPGQIVDRISILRLKLAAYKENNVSGSAILEEYQQCKLSLAALVGKLTPSDAMKFTELSERLERQNAALWTSEHDEREMAKAFQAKEPSYSELLDFVRLRTKSQKGNETRALLVAEIDRLFNSPIEPKFY